MVKKAEKTLNLSEISLDYMGKKKMIQIQKKSDCCGCGACMNISQKSCIRMSCDYEGLLYPKVDIEKS